MALLPTQADIAISSDVRSIRIATIAAKHAFITSADVMQTEDILMTRREMKKYFIAVFSEYSNERIDILSEKGKRLLATAEDIGVPLPDASWREIETIVTWYKNIKHMTGDQIKASFPAHYFKSISIPAALQQYDFSIRYIEGCGNHCRTCPVQHKPISHYMPFPLVVQLAILADEGKMIFKSGFEFEFLYWADAIYEKDGNVQADVLFADVKKVIPLIHKEKIEQKETGQIVWTLISHGSTTNKKRIDYDIAQLNMRRFQMIGQAGTVYASISRCDLDLSIDTNSVLWAEFRSRAVKELRDKDPQVVDRIRNTISAERGEVHDIEKRVDAQLWEQYYRDNVIQQYLAYYETFIKEWTDNHKNRVSLRIYRSPREFKEHERKERDAVADAVYSGLLQKRREKLLMFDIIDEEKRGGPMKVLSRRAFKYVIDEHDKRKGIWSPLLEIYRKNGFTRPINYVITYDGTIDIQFDPIFVNITEAGIEISKSDKIKIARSIAEEPFLLKYYVSRLPNEQQALCTEIRQLQYLDNDLSKIMTLLLNENKTKLEKKATDLVDFLIAMQVPVPLYALKENIADKLAAEYVVPEFKWLPMTSLFVDEGSGSSIGLYMEKGIHTAA